MELFNYKIGAGHGLFSLMLGLGLVLIAALPALAGEPTGEIGPMNPTMFQCIDEDGGEIELDTVQDMISNDPSTETSSCSDNFNGVSDFGFDTTDAEKFRGYLRDLEEECDEEGGDLVPLQKTRIEGIVYEFHPVDPANPLTSEWQGVPSRDVLVTARGITFNINWGSEKDGTFFFPNLGAGPVVLSLGLPGDAHPINSDLVVKSSGREETLSVFLGFYRGDLPAPNAAQLRLPGGSLPFAAQEDIVLANECGLPMPNVGGVRPAGQPLWMMFLAAALLVLLPAGGLMQLKHRS